MINEQEKTLNAMGAKTARACDSCVYKRARWYCPADDAFLCQSCDTSVHSANQLARRHERVRLGGSSRCNNLSTLNVPPSVSWPKKTRTPRHHHKITPPCAKQDRGNEGSNYLQGEEVGNFFEPDVVPEMGCEEGLLSSPIEYEDQRIHRVPVIDPFMEEEDGMIQIGSETNDLDGADDLETFQGFLASNLDFEDFDGDWQVSSLVKVKEEDHGYIDREFGNNLELEMAPETTLVCGLRCPSRGVKEEDRETAMTKAVVEKKFDTVGKKFLSLNYEAVLAAWDSQGSPWTTGIRPDFDPSNCLPDCMADTTLFAANYHPSGEMTLLGGPKGYGGLSDDIERGAKVSRYREKRRSRLFSKKIRYEVRKLNAEKRPRMKGRFVKRSSTAVPVPFAYLNSNN